MSTVPRSPNAHENTGPLYRGLYCSSQEQLFISIISQSTYAHAKERMVEPQDVDGEAVVPTTTAGKVFCCLFGGGKQKNNNPKKQHRASKTSTSTNSAGAEKQTTVKETAADGTKKKQKPTPTEPTASKRKKGRNKMKEQHKQPMLNIQSSSLMEHSSVGNGGDMSSVSCDESEKDLDDTTTGLTTVCI